MHSIHVQFIYYVQYACTVVYSLCCVFVFIWTCGVNKLFFSLEIQVVGGSGEWGAGGRIVMWSGL